MSAGGPSRRARPPRRANSGTPAGEPGAHPEVEITLRAMRFHALVGILEHERTIPQPLEVDLTVHGDRAAGLVDYRRLYDVVREVVTRAPIDYLEDAAERIADAVLADARVSDVRVALRKPHVSLPGPLAYAEVALERRRAGASE